ncbi:putative ATP-grasp superfamily ATP-dependent carboligase [Methanohalophilus levihalophilus]|uniref:ATP-grasp domain-containing protein n=1 Tax=Methanohalophilus levihalophilus TaxID=1431282 RepID=UPI001AE85C42|nr:ATP-grasp domain-containing protein [Methanohalophilus levihalophilus]MBP2030957.1 putative ATP-grasp superfamily ATP-dependent carboligase [Methanohalophilus levihalophilus]
MKILISEYATSVGMGGTYLIEGKSMLKCLASSFENEGHEVIYTSADIPIGCGKMSSCEQGKLEESLDKLSSQCDAALVIAPDDILADLTGIVEKNTVNLGSIPDSIRKCADKLECSRILEKNGIPSPKTVSRQSEMDAKARYVVKPRYGCASEDTVIASGREYLKEGHIATEYIDGEHLSVSLVCSDSILPITINKQIIETGNQKDNITIDYRGSVTPYETKRSGEVINAAIEAARTLGCRGYTGIDIVLAEKPYVIDINPRPTTSLVGITQILKTEIAELLLLAADNNLPETVAVEGTVAFTKEDLK